MPRGALTYSTESVDDNLVVGRQVGGSNALAQPRISQDTTNFAQKRCNNVKRTGNIGRIEFPRTAGARRRQGSIGEAATVRIFTPTWSLELLEPDVFDRLLKATKSWS